MNDDSPTSDELEQFGRLVHQRLTKDAPFGSLSKSELELTIFSSLVESQILNLDLSSFDLARSLRCTPTRANSLVFNYHLRTSSSKNFNDELAAAVHIVKDKAAAEDHKVVLNVEQKFWREMLVNELKKHETFTDTSFNRERLTLDESQFLDACETLFGSRGEIIAKEVKKKDKGAEKVAKIIQGMLIEGLEKAGSHAISVGLPMLAEMIIH
ncbi:hypothetical protein [Propionibacterium sp.]|uniref:hypothetical protein n=1 Tax=Propionibacterium sp. TaxID=1977903 RepID=UPI0039EB184E